LVTAPRTKVFNVNFALLNRTTSLKMGAQILMTRFIKFDDPH
jgi:hypothetical protein